MPFQFEPIYPYMFPPDTHFHLSGEKIGNRWGQKIIKIYKKRFRGCWAADDAFSC